MMQIFISLCEWTQQLCYEHTDLDCPKSIWMQAYNSRIPIYLLKIDLHSHPSIYSIYIQNPTFPQYLLNTGFIHFFIEQNQGLFNDFPGQKLVFKHLFLSIFIYKTLFNLTFFQVKMPVPSTGTCFW